MPRAKNASLIFVSPKSNEGMNNDDIVYVLNPDYVLKNDHDKILLYSHRLVESYSQSNWSSFIHPVQAILLSFFTYERPLGENIRLLARFLQKEASVVRKMLSPYLENPHPFHTEWKKIQIDFPSHILINAERVKAGSAWSRRHIPVKEMACSKVDLANPRIHTMPLHATFMLTNRCVTRCKYCYADTATAVEKEVSADRWLEVIDELVRLNVQDIHLIGGEIFLYKQWPVLLKKLVDTGYCPEIISTKCPVNEWMVGQLKSTGFTGQVQISLDSVSSETLQPLLQVDSGYWEKLKQGLLWLDRAAVPMKIATVLTTYNSSVEEIENLYRFIASLKHVESWSLCAAMNSLYQNKETLPFIKAKKEVLEEIYAFIETKLKPEAAFEISFNRGNMDREFYHGEEGSSSFKGPKCSALNSHIFVLPDGKVTICEQLYWHPAYIIGDLSVQNVLEVWNSERVHYLMNLPRKDVREGSACKTCGLFEACIQQKNRCWVNVIKAYGEENWDYPDPRCKQAPTTYYQLNY